MARRGIRAGPSAPAFCQVTDVFERSISPPAASRSLWNGLSIALIVVLGVSVALNAYLCFTRRSAADGTAEEKLVNTRGG
jgi:hypothetical protein